jgi:kinesin family protein C2/C3
MPPIPPSEISLSSPTQLVNSSLDSSENDNKVLALNLEIEKLNAKIISDSSELHTQISAHQDTISKKHSELLELKENHSNLIKNKDLEISNLNSQIAEYKNEIERQKLLSESSDKSGLLEEELERVKAEVSELIELNSVTTIESEERISELNNEADIRINDITTKAEIKSSQLEKQIEQYKSDIELMKTTSENSNLDSSKQITQIKEESDNKITGFEKQILELNKKIADISLESEKKMKQAIVEIKLESDVHKKEIETRLESEKEEMIEAMALELEAVESAKEVEKKVLFDENLKTQQHLKQVVAENNKNKANLEKIKTLFSRVSAEMKNVSVKTKKDLTDMKHSLQTQFASLIMNKLKGTQVEITAMTTKFKQEMSERKKLHNIIQELKGNIRVYMRSRPPTNKEIEQFGHDALCCSFPGNGEVRVFNEKNREKVWEFDEVFGLDTNQAQIYKEVSGLVTSVLDGYNVCIFAYGQTGSGKTYTMSGPSEDRGVNTRALGELFDKSNARSDEWIDTITVNLLEVYNEEIRDILIESHEKLDIRQGEFGNFVPGLTTVTVTCLQNVIDLLSVADRNRSSASTNMNEHSSRSHMMLTVNITSESRSTGIATRGKLNLVDLAGSERINKSGATGTALKEAQNINKSLSALGDVIAARANKQSHVPFRNSTLTYLLQDSLSQDSKTLMIVCISPVLYNSEETFCSLNFASRVRQVELGKATKNTATSASAAPGRAAPSGRLNTGIRK